MRNKPNRWLNKHHKFPKCEGWTMHHDNLLVMQEFKHKCLHILFDENGKATMPHRQIEIYMGMMWKAIITEVHEDIKQILDEYWMDMYNHKCIK